jgi:hypothetical protein
VGAKAKGRAAASRMQLRRGGEGSGRGTDDAERTAVVGSASTVQSRVVRSRSVTAPAGSAAGHDVALALAGAGPMGWQHRSRPADRGDPPYDARGRDSLNQSPTTGSDFPRSQFAPSRADRIFPAQKTAPSFSNDGYLAEDL